MIEFKNVEKVYDDGFRALKNVSFQVQEGELFVLIGPSGCGKTTTMKMINRLIEPTSGTIKIEGRPISEENPVELRRNIGYVIQQIGLLPHMTIRENVSLVPRLKKWNKEKYEQRVNELMEMVGLAPDIYGDRYPNELSGGQQQRIGVIRGLAAEPKIILMDEPFSALDPISREQLQDELVRLQKEIHKTIVFVTHDMDEALKIADRICLMKDGEIVQLDTPENILRHPANDFVRDFIGEDRIDQYTDQQDSVSLPSIKKLITRPVTAFATRGLAEALTLMRQKRVDTLLITDRESEKYLGVVTIWDLQKAYRDEQLTLNDIKKNDVPPITADVTPEAAVQSVTQSPYGLVPVVDHDGKLLGIINRSGLVKHVIGQLIQ